MPAAFRSTVPQEKRKRNAGQATKAKNFVEEEKRLQVRRLRTGMSS